MAKKSEDKKSESGVGLLNMMPQQPVFLGGVQGNGLLGGMAQQGSPDVVADNMMYQQLPTLDAAKQRLIELQGLGYNGYVVPLGSDQYGHEIRVWKDPSTPSLNPNKSTGK